MGRVVFKQHKRVLRMQTHYDVIKIALAEMVSEARGKRWAPFNITRAVAKIVAASRVKEGVAVIQTKHTTTGLIVNENEAGLLEFDFPRFLARIIPEEGYRHDCEERLRALTDEPANGASHVRSLVAGATSLSLIVHEGVLTLGSWQAILFLDFDPENRSERTIAVQVMGRTARS